MVDGDIVDHGLGQRHIAQIVDAEFIPGPEAEFLMGPAIPARHMADSARARCWSRSVEPLPELWGTPTSPMSQAAGSPFHGHL
jgi:hypothetical protein